MPEDAAADSDTDIYRGQLECPAPGCGGKEFEPEDPDNGLNSSAMCLSCGESVPPTEFPWVKKYEHFVIASVEEVEKGCGGNKKLNKLTVRVSPDGEEDPTLLSIVTNDLKVKVDDRVVVAQIGAIVPAGKSLDDGGEEVKKASVSSTPSEGMLCDSVLLDWVGGGKGAAVKFSDKQAFKVGDRPPDKKPR